MNTPALPCPPPREIQYPVGWRVIRRVSLATAASISLLTILWGISRGFEAQEYFQNRRETTGTVVDATSHIEGSPKGKHRTIFETNIRFRDELSVEHRLRATISYDQFKDLAPGSEVPVVYRIDNPDLEPRAFDDDDHRAAAKRAWTTPLFTIVTFGLIWVVFRWQVHREFALARSGQAIMGHVTRIDVKRGAKGGHRYNVYYSFDSPMIKPRTGWAQFYLKPELEVGSPVVVLYDPLRRRRHRLVLDLKFVDPDSLHWPERHSPKL